MWIRCCINGDMLNLDYVEEIEIVEMTGTIGTHYEIQAVYPTKTKRRKCIFIGDLKECTEYSKHIGKKLNIISNPNKKTTVAKVEEVANEHRINSSNT